MLSCILNFELGERPGLRLGRVDPTTAQHDLAVEADDGLTWGDGALRLVEGDPDFVGGGELHRGGLRLVVVADLGAATNRR